MQSRDELVDKAKELTALLKSMGAVARERQEVFQRLREEHEMTYAAIGEEVGLTRQAVEAICKGRGLSTPQ